MVEIAHHAWPHAPHSKVAEALSAYSEALRLNLDYAEAHFNLGVAYCLLVSDTRFL